jgi:hypothetical protein
MIGAGRRKESKRDRDSREEAPGGQHVTRARSWWKRGDVSACAAQTNMECWVHQDIILDDNKARQSVKEAWEHEDDKDELKIELQGLERQFCLGTEAGRLGCNDFLRRDMCESAVFYQRAINATRPCELNNWIQLFSSHGLVAFIARW